MYDIVSQFYQAAFSLCQTNFRDRGILLGRSELIGLNPGLSPVDPFGANEHPKSSRANMHTVIGSRLSGASRLCSLE